MNQNENNKPNFPIGLDAAVLDCKDPSALADFYVNLLGWKKNYSDEAEWADIISPTGGTKIAFQKNDLYIPPIWPEEEGAQQQMAHLDFTVGSKEEMERAVSHALSCGAKMAEKQYGGDKWITMTDPAGHPFCFVLWP
ncbi:MAG: VOC family protein [Lachnospiraceae bacterium]|nr:VOC family protein [Lachnospiraceae bacterium]